LHALICGQRAPKVESGAAGVLIDLDAIIDGVATGPDGTRRTAETSGGTPLPVETIRRIACEAGIIPIVLNGAGQALDVGRERRLATRAQRTALRAQYPTCGMDAGCAPRLVGALPMTQPPPRPRRRLDPHPPTQRHLATQPTPTTTPMNSATFTTGVRPKRVGPSDAKSAASMH
jgi:hypothetical protein